MTAQSAADRFAQTLGQTEGVMSQIKTLLAEYANAVDNPNWGHVTALHDLKSALEAARGQFQHHVGKVSK